MTDLNINAIQTHVQEGHSISETVGKLDALNADLDALLEQQQKVQMDLLEINAGISELKRVYGV